MSKGESTSDSGRNKEISKVIAAASSVLGSNGKQADADLNLVIEDPRLFRHTDRVELFDSSGDGKELDCVFWSMRLVDSYWQALERGLLHRDGAPAVEWEDGGETWCLYGEVHREDGPADTGSHSKHGWIECWYRNGQQHRDDDLPAVECASGAREWWRNGEKHRDGDKPAHITANGSRSWYQHDQLHRENDKPAVINADGSLEWRIEGELHRSRDLPAFVSTTGGGCGWWHHGQQHRDYDPACIDGDGTYSWYRFGKLHRDDDEPAVVGPGRRAWFWRGKSHREGGQPSTTWNLGDRQILSWEQHGVEIAQLVLPDYGEPICLTTFETGPGQSSDCFTDQVSIAEALVDRALMLPDNFASPHQAILRSLAVEMLVAINDE